MLDKMRLQQILLNLLSNAIKFSKENDTITVKARVSKIIDKKFFTVTIDVIDTGIGISEDD
jgi:two-component system cell cycle sensor histidine kinase PleC